jgi:Tol biopolymer transport system component
MKSRPLLASAVALVALLGVAAGQAPPQPVTHGGAPSVSPDGSKIAFLSDRDGATDVWVISADGSGETRLTRTPEAESQPDWSADGRRVWFTVFASEASRIYSIQPDGQNQQLLGTVPGRAMRLSPDGHRVLSWTGTWTSQKLFSSDLDGGNVRQLTDGSGVVWGARWSPDGKRIAFADHDSGGVLHVFVIKADGSDRRQVTHLPASEGQAQIPAWSPDGRHLAVQASGKGLPGHIWIVDPATGDARKLAPHDRIYQDEVPAWFPDGKRIAFQSDRTGRMEIWVMNSDGSAARQLTR